MAPDPPQQLVQAGQNRRQSLQTGAQGVPSLPMNVLSMTMEKVVSNGWKIEHERMGELPTEYHSRVARTGIISPGAQFYKTRLLGQNLQGEWEGILGPGLMIVQFVAQAEDAYLNWVSSLIGFIYRQTFPGTDLSSVFIHQVSDVHTMGLYHNHVCQNSKNGESIQPVTFESGSRLYDALLGTEYGKIVFALVLASERTTLHISRITIWVEDNSVQLRFDIELYGANASTVAPQSSRPIDTSNSRWLGYPTPIAMQVSRTTSLSHSITSPSSIDSRVLDAPTEDEDESEDETDSEDETECEYESEEEDSDDESPPSPPTSMERVRQSQSLPRSSPSKKKTSLSSRSRVSSSAKKSSPPVWRSSYRHG